MKRDIDAIRTILLAVRDSDGPVNSIDGMGNEKFLFHAQLLIEAKLAIGSIVEDVGTNEPLDAGLNRLTWAGHDFADATVDKTVWEKAKTRLIGSSASWTFDILREVVVSVVKDGLGLN